MAKRRDKPDTPTSDTRSRARAPGASTKAGGRRGKAHGGNGVTAAEAESRLADTESAMLRHAKDRDAAREVQRLHSVRYNTAMMWCRKVRERWKAEAEARPVGDRESERHEQIERYTDLYRRALEGGSLKVAVAAADRIAQLRGFLTNKVEVTGKDGGPLEFLQKMSDAQLEDIVRRAREGASGG